jgi:hypothetical protein
VSRPGAGVNPKETTVQYKIGWRRLYQTLGVEPPSYGSALTTTLLADGAMLQTYFGEAPDKGAMRTRPINTWCPGALQPSCVRSLMPVEGIST